MRIFWPSWWFAVVKQLHICFSGSPTKILGILGLSIYRWKRLENTFPTMYYMPPNFWNCSRKPKKKNMQSFSDCRSRQSKKPQWQNNYGSFLQCFLLVLRARSHMTSHFTWGSMTTLNDCGGVLGWPLDTFFWALTISWSRLLAHVWSIRALIPAFDVFLELYLDNLRTLSFGLSQPYGHGSWLVCGSGPDTSIFLFYFLGGCLGTAFGHFLLGSHNLMVTAFGSYMEMALIPGFDFFSRCLGTAFGHFLLGSHNLMVTAHGPCVEVALIPAFFDVPLQSKVGGSPQESAAANLGGISSHEATELWIALQRKQESVVAKFGIWSWTQLPNTITTISNHRRRSIFYTGTLLVSHLTCAMHDAHNSSHSQHTNVSTREC